MNYLAEILTFENWVEYNSQINKSDIRLWYTLMHIANRFGWREFTVPISTLIFKSKLSRSDIYRARNKLKQFRILEFKDRGNSQCVSYKINSVVSLYGKQIDTYCGTPFETGLGTPLGTKVDSINKTKNYKPETINNKESITNVVPKKKFGEFGNVLLLDEEFDKLKSKFPDYESRIERISSYLASSGKRYKSHYATILSWAGKDDQNKGGMNYEPGRKYPARKICTEYPE